MQVTVLITLSVRESGAALPGVDLQLWSQAARRNRFGPALKGVPLATGVTDATGRAQLVVDLPPATGTGGARSAARQTPSVRLLILNQSGNPVQATTHSIKAVGGRARIATTLAGAVALAHHLVGRKPRLSRAERQQRLGDYWRKRLASGPSPRPEIELCLARVLLDTVVASSSPKSDIEKQVAVALAHRIPAEHLERVRGLAKDAHELLGSSHGGSGMPCSAGSSPNEIAKMLISPGGPLSATTQALSESAPPPDQDLGVPKAGLPFTRPFDEWVKDCAAAFEGGDLPADATEQMQEWYPDQLQLLQPPRINQVDIYEPRLSNYVRHGRPADKTLEIRDLDPVDGWLSMVQPMRLPLDDEDVLVLQEDPDEGGTQVLATDVTPGQTVRLLGSGLIADAVTVRARFARWSGLDDDGRLVPDSALVPVFGWNGTDLDVHGLDTHEPTDSAENFLGDRIVFDWPEQASEAGIYRVELEVPNDLGLPTGAVQDPGSCTLEVEVPERFGIVLWFAVLPALDPARTRVRATSVECIDETNPEAMLVNLFDDVTLSASGQITRQILNGSDPSSFDLETVVTNTAEGNHWFWDDGDTWTPNLRVLPPGDDVFRVLRLDEFLNGTLLASEIEGEADRIIMRSLVIALLVVVLILIVALAVAVVVILVAAEIITVGLATPIIAIISTIATVLFGTLLVGAIASIEALFASLPAGDPLGVIMPIFSGPEVAHLLSPVRFHRVLWIRERPPLPETSIPTTRTTEITAGSISEVYRCDATSLGGIYRFRLVLDTP